MAGGQDCWVCTTLKSTNKRAGPLCLLGLWSTPWQILGTSGPPAADWLLTHQKGISPVCWEYIVPGDSDLLSCLDIRVLLFGDRDDLCHYLCCLHVWPAHQDTDHQLALECEKGATMAGLGRDTGSCDCGGQFWMLTSLFSLHLTGFLPNPCSGHSLPDHLHCGARWERKRLQNRCRGKGCGVSF